MTARLRILCHAATKATRNSTFPDNEPIEPGEIERIVASAPSLPRFDEILRPNARAPEQTLSALGVVGSGVDDALRDLDYGRWKGKSLEEVLADDGEAFRAWMTTPLANPHGGDSIASLIERVGCWLDRDTFKGRILAVTHQAVLRAAIVHVLGAPEASFWAIDAGPLTSADFSHDGSRWRLRCGQL